jgi:thioredoxin 1
MSKLTEINSSEEFKKVLSSERIVIADFYANWCGPCKSQLPILEKYAKNNQDIQVVKINVDENPELSSEYGVKSIPTLIYFKSGNIEYKTVGVQQENQLNEIKKEII